MHADSTVAARALAASQQGLVSAGQLERLGFARGRMAHRLATGDSRALLPGVYVFDGWVHPDAWCQLPLVVRVRAAVLMHGPATVICLETAARLRGIGGVGLDDGLIHVQLPPGRERHQVNGVVIHTRLLAPDEWSELDGVRVTTPQRTVLDLVLSSSRTRAVQILDSALNREQLSPDDLDAMRRRARGRRGAAISRSWWALADGRSESPLETVVRLIAIDAELPPDELQYPVRDPYGVLLGRGDLAWIRPGRRTLIAEADGREPHELPEAVFRDRRRANDFVATGEVDVIRFTWADTRRPAYIVTQLRRLLTSP